MQYFIALVVLVQAFFAIYRIRMFGAKGISKHWFAAAFSIKVFASLAMIWLYSDNYYPRKTADIFKYYDDALVFRDVLLEAPADFFSIMSGIGSHDESLQKYYDLANNWDNQPMGLLSNNHHFIIRITSILAVITFGSNLAISIIFSFLAFTGLFWIFRFFKNQRPENSKFIFLLVFGIPSVIFWTSGITKEALLIFFIGLVLNCGSLALKGKKAIPRILLVIMALWVIFLIKTVVALILVFAIIPYLWTYFNPSKPVLKYFIAIFLLAAIVSESGKFMSKSVAQNVADKNKEFVALARDENARSVVENINLDGSAISLVKNSMPALVNSLFRPFFNFNGGFAISAASIENFLILLAFTFIISGFNPKMATQNVLLFSLLFSIMLLIASGLAIPVLGALSRYRVIGLVILLPAMALVFDRERSFVKKIWS